MTDLDAAARKLASAISVNAQRREWVELCYAALRAEREPLLDALVAVRDILKGCQQQLGFHPGQNGYSTTMSTMELRVANGIISVNTILSQQGREEG